ncbi:DUF3021 domain-containing protein [Companilactobacillus jidongensis]|uniref:DUF3021 domain-containing protein n=1 Tax=Companilactobacillus jidongensis TaxID=2486006 RepID=UPI000F7B4BD9|nr:DUF3021 domain-containing protein [Companilactobacillus jidongensis]
MTKFLKTIRYFLIGVLLGSFSFLVVGLFSGGIGIDVREILSLFFFSGLIGIVSMIFDTDWFSFPIRLLIHMLVTIIIVMIMMYTAGWQLINHLGSFVITVIVIYGLVWLIMYLADITDTKKINNAIRKRKSK